MEFIVDKVLAFILKNNDFPLTTTRVKERENHKVIEMKKNKFDDPIFFKKIIIETKEEDEFQLVQLDKCEERYIIFNLGN